jgi:hypothetical protein
MESISLTNEATQNRILWYAILTAAHLHPMQQLTEVLKDFRKWKGRRRRCFISKDLLLKVKQYNNYATSSSIFRSDILYHLYYVMILRIIFPQANNFSQRLIPNFMIVVAKVASKTWKYVAKYFVSKS